MKMRCDTGQLQSLYHNDIFNLHVTEQGKCIMVNNWQSITNTKRMDSLTEISLEGYKQSSRLAALTRSSLFLKWRYQARRTKLTFECHIHDKYSRSHLAFPSPPPTPPNWNLTWKIIKKYYNWIKNCYHKGRWAVHTFIYHRLNCKHLSRLHDSNCLVFWRKKK